MNPRIRELIKQATEYYGNGSERTFDREKFAELIIKEHIDLLRNEWYELNNQPVIENESPRDIGLRVGRKIEINVLLEKIRKHWYIETLIDLRRHELEVEEHMEKFAELIVEKCAKHADEPTSHPFQSYDVMIEKHFGVKE